MEKNHYRYRDKPEIPTLIPIFINENFRNDGE